MAKLNGKDLIFIFVVTCIYSAWYINYLRRNKVIEEYELSLEPVIEEKEFDYFKDAREEIEVNLSVKEYDYIKDAGNRYLREAIDFIYDDVEIEGFYYENLEEEIKEEMIIDVRAIDNIIMTYYPDYKDNLTEKYKI